VSNVRGESTTVAKQIGVSGGSARTKTRKMTGFSRESTGFGIHDDL